MWVKKHIYLLCSLWWVKSVSNTGSSPKAFQVRCRGSCRAAFLNFDIPSLWEWHLFPHTDHHHHDHDHHRCCPSSQDCMRVVKRWLRIRSHRCRLHLATEHLIPPTLSSPITCSAKNVHCASSSYPESDMFNYCTAQCYRCQLGCFSSQKFPCIWGSCYRSILSEIRVWKSQKPTFLIVA